MVKIASIGRMKRKKRILEAVDSEGRIYILAEDTALIKAVAEGNEYSDMEWNAILTDSDTVLGMEYALLRLSTGMRSEKDIRDKLREKSVCPEAAGRVIARLKELKYLDDRQFASELIASRSASRGKLWLKSELYNKGVPKEIAEEALKGLKDETCGALAQAEKFLKGAKPEGKTREKLIRHLLARGYTYDIIKKAVNRLGGDADDISDI